MNDLKCRWILSDIHETGGLLHYRISVRYYSKKQRKAIPEPSVFFKGGPKTMKPTFRVKCPFNKYSQ